jgi:serine/threonine-protein kinase RsbW
MNGSAWSARLSAGLPTDDDLPDGDGVMSEERAAPAGPAGMNFHETYAAAPESIPVVRAALRRFVRDCGVSVLTSDAVALASSEAATNVVMHAYREVPDSGQLEVTAALASGELWVIVTDAGSGLRPRRDSPGLGLGLAIIAQVADSVDLVKPAGGGLELRMRFLVDSRAPSTR